MEETKKPDNIPETDKTDMISEPNLSGTTETPSGKKKAVGKKKSSRLFIALGVLFCALLFLYFVIGFHYQKVFLPATMINDIDVSGLTSAQALARLNAGADKYTLTLVEEDGASEQISGSDIGLFAEDGDRLQELIDGQAPFTWVFRAFQEKSYSLDVSYDAQKLSETVEALACMDKKSWKAPKDAYITYEKGTGYRIVPEVPGTVIVPDTLLAAIGEAVKRLDASLTLRDAGVYTLPRIPSDDAALQERFAKLAPYSDMTVTYQFGEQQEVLDGDMLSEWIDLDKNGRLTIDEEAVAEFVKELAKKYNTAYSSKTLETSYGKTITVKGGFYGWQIDRKTETEDLLGIIRRAESITKEPAYLLRAASHDEIDYGDTYVEINLTAQHLFFYKDGELVIETDFVSGDLSKGKETPDGAYAITYKERNSTLSGEGYRTKVSYWMPFNGNIGMHDCAWRPAFGGLIYQTNGSRGCINLPAEAAKTIYENIEQGDPVICYHLPGTGPEPVRPAVEQPLPTLPPAVGEIPGQIPNPETAGIPIPPQEVLPEGDAALPIP